MLCTFAEQMFGIVERRSPSMCAFLLTAQFLLFICFAGYVPSICLSVIYVQIHLNTKGKVALMMPNRPFFLSSCRFRCLAALPAHVLQHCGVQLFFTSTRPPSHTHPATLPSSPTTAPGTSSCEFSSNSSESLFHLRFIRYSACLHLYIARRDLSVLYCLFCYILL